VATLVASIPVEHEGEIVQPSQSLSEKWGNKIDPMTNKMDFFQSAPPNNQVDASGGDLSSVSHFLGEEILKGRRSQICDIL
jgi:hypothetical protein